MNVLFAGASAGTLRSLAEAFRTGRLGATASRLTIGRVCPCPDTVVANVTQLLGEGLAPAHLALLLDARADAIDGRVSGTNPIELVWTGPETGVSYSRDTSVVLRELFQSARRSVLVSTFVVNKGKTVFEALARRMEDVPDLRVQIFLHVGRERRDKRHESELLREFADNFRTNWPGSRTPEIYYEPRAVAANTNDRATWHAKCVLVDDEVALVTSANFTEWAQTRNVEAGVIVRDGQFTSQLRAQFDGLVQAKLVARLPGY
ncbi:MAG TPA: DISARM system phospholipase D-like protein DrmC [Vicinamibacterales bacterium]|nr:DISARM system phospholipase D-like protein DrmC [Vicinamibacterales bacterium]